MRAPSLSMTLLTATLLAAGCTGTTDPPADTGESDTDDTDSLVIVPDTATPMETDTDTDTDTGTPPVVRTPCTTDGDTDLSGWCDLSVNNAFVDVPTTAGGTLFLRIEGTSTSGPNPAGGFNGNGFGNRSLAGLHQLDATKLSDVGAVEVQARPVTGSTTLDLILRVDLDCDGQSVVPLYSPSNRWTTTMAGGWQTLSLSTSKFAWFAYGGLADPDTVGETIADDPQQASPPAQPVPMDTITAAYPDACLKNGSVTEGSLPAGTLSAVLLAVGSDVNTSTKARWEVRSMTLASTTWASPTE